MRPTRRRHGAAPRSPSELPTLPVLGSPGTPRPRSRASRSRASRWRVAVLVGVHVAFLLHLTHYLVAGRTISPVEPSESMYAIELGQLNAGLVFFALAIVSTAVFGRFFCGWGCHLVALQDLCGALMRRLGVRPRPLRSRLLVLLPLGLALYMFAWPTFRRVVLGQGPPFPGFSSHFVTDDFWRTFPGPLWSALTLLGAGFAAVVLLGSKGFCTYGCPYGAIFAAADRVAPMRVIADDNCVATGACTPACTSNVVVHEQVALHRMVTDPGCMKCMDCVAACPTGALSVGWGRPAVLVRDERPARAAGSADRPRWSQELLLGLVALGALLAFRGLYDGPPLLLAAALGAMTAFVALKAWQLARERTVRFQSWTLRAGGELTRQGVLFGVGAVAWLAFTAHSGWVQAERALGRRALDRTEVGREAGLSGRFDPAGTSAAHRAAAASAHRHFTNADRWGLFDVIEVQVGLGWTHLLRGDVDLAAGHLRRAIALDPDDPVLHDNLVEMLAARGRLDGAAAAQAAKMAACEPTVVDHVRAGELAVGLGRLDEAERQFRAAVALAPDDVVARHDLGGLLSRTGRPAEAVEHLAHALALAPGEADTRAELARALALSGREAEAQAVAQGR